MRAVAVAILLLGATSVAAAAGDLDHHHARAFWLDAQPWPNPQPGAANNADQPTDPRFAMTFTDALATRLGVGNGRAQFFSTSLDSDDASSPKLTGTVDGGAARLSLRW